MDCFEVMKDSFKFYLQLEKFKSLVGRVFTWIRLHSHNRDNWRTFYLWNDKGVNTLGTSTIQMKRSFSNNLLENHKLRLLQLWKIKELGWLLRLQNAFIHGPRSNNKTIGKGSIPPKATMNVVQEDYNYKENNSQSTKEGKGDQTMK